MNVTSVLAIIWGAIISTIALTWNITRSLWERRLKVELVFSLIPPDYNEKRLAAIMTNTGRRPILVTKWCGKIKDKEKAEFVVQPRGLPRILEETEYHIEFLDDISIILKIKTMYIKDSTGKSGKSMHGTSAV